MQEGSNLSVFHVAFSVMIGLSLTPNVTGFDESHVIIFLSKHISARKCYIILEAFMYAIKCVSNPNIWEISLFTKTVKDIWLKW